MQCGEQALLPAVRGAAPDTLVIANGFSCKTQIQQAGSERRALHVAQAISMAREHGRSGYLAELPEKPYYGAGPLPSTRQRVVRLGSAGAIATAALLASTALLKRRR